jgi:DDE superfamily endonuclease
VDGHFPEKKKIILVMDNLDTHKLGSLYAAYKPEDARRIVERLEIHYTPKHGGLVGYGGNRDWRDVSTMPWSANA